MTTTDEVWSLGSFPGQDVLFRLFFVLPLLGIGERVFLLSDVVAKLLPLLREVGIPLRVVCHVLGQLVVGINGLHGAHRHTGVAVDALVWVNYEEVRPLIKTVHRADFYTIRVFAVDAGFSDDVRHSGLCRIP